MLIKNATIYTMTDTGIENGDILIQDGKIAKVGKDLSSPGAEVIDASGLVALPGLVETHSHLGGFNASMPEDMDLNEMTDPITPQVQAIHGVDPTDKSFQFAYKAGVTTMCITPGSGNVIGGQSFALKTYGTNVYEMTIKNPCSMKVALGGNPKNVYGPKNQMPMTRMGIAAMLRATFRDATDYLKKKEEAGDDKTKLPPYDVKLEALIPVIKREIPIKAHCEQFDMVTIIDICKEFNIDYSTEHSWAAEDYYDELVAGGGNIMFGPIGVPNGYGELTGADIWCVKKLDEMGANVCLITDAPIYSADALVVHAGEAVRWGVPVERALRMITINGAKALRLSDRIGSIEVGKDADIVLFSGIPALDTRARVAYTIIDGTVVHGN